MNPSIDEAVSKLRTTFYGILNCGLHPDGLIPPTLTTIYQTVVLPKALYGCELWNSVQSSAMLRLERAHRECIKCIQKIPRNTSTVISLGALGMFPIEAEIAKRKLIFFGQICRLPEKYIAKQFFVHRLINYLNGDKQVIGYIPDMYKLLSKFNLLHVLDVYSVCGTFPEKQAWKNAVKRKVHEWYVNERNETLQGLMSDQHISTVFQGENMCLFWSLCKGNRSMKDACYNAVYILGRLYSYTDIECCNKCNELTNKLTLHKIFYCAVNHTTRCDMWLYILNCIGINAYLDYILQDERNQLCDILSGFRDYNSAFDYNARLCSCLTYLFRLCK
jgi:hypothetical protein